VLARHVEPALDEPAERGRALEGVVEVLAVAVEERVVELGLAREMPVERARRQPRVAGDVGQAGARVPALGERVATRRKEGLTRGNSVDVRGGGDKLPSGY